MNRLLEFLVPRFPLRDLPVMLGFAMLGSLIAGVYGVIHDQITYTIGPEYFTKFKFVQFSWFNFELPDRIFVACIGFLATWWIGLIVSWFLCRRMLRHHARSIAYRKIWQGIGLVFATGLLFGIGGYVYGLICGPDGDYAAWRNTLLQLQISDTWSFIRVAYIHNAGYLGGLAGLIATFFLIKMPTETATTQSSQN